MTSIVLRKHKRTVNFQNPTYRYKFPLFYNVRFKKKTCVKLSDTHKNTTLYFLKKYTINIYSIFMT